MHLTIQDHFNRELPADPNLANTRRQVFKACYSYVTPRKPSAPELIHVSEEMADLLGITAEDIQSGPFLHTFSGKTVLEQSQPYSMCYGGHQFGQWAGQLGDGRAINLAEIEHQNKVWTLQLKGAGETPYSRTADGLAVLRSSIREHLCSEAMFHLGVPTTRSLSLMLTGDEVLRDMLYDGNPAYEKGAVVCRVAPSFIRFGNFEIFASRGDIETLRQLADFTIKHYYPDIKLGSRQSYVDFFRQVAHSTIEMIVHSQRVGFVHGVMNTDNMSILGLTIDYGPYGWLEGYDPTWTPNTTDRQTRRYRFGNQPGIAVWNLLQLANALYPLVEQAEPFEEILRESQTRCTQAYAQMMHQKLGLSSSPATPSTLVEDLLKVLSLSETDMTLFFRQLSHFSKDTKVAEGADFLPIIEDAFYRPEEIQGDILAQWRAWFRAYQQELQQEARSDVARGEAMRQVNPKYVLRNYMAQLSIDAANGGDYALIHELHEVLKRPYDEQPEYEQWFAKRPEWARHKVGCSMLSCSS